MGNSQTKESRSSGGRSNRDVPSPVRAEHHPPPSHIPPRPPYSTRPRRGSRPDLSFLGIGGSGEPEASALEARRETKAEREARKLEKERATRIRDRERSMKEEHADGGYLVTQGVYVGTEDFNKNIVRQLMIERRLAPFWRGLNDFSESWAEHQLMAAARGMSIPPADMVPPELEYRLATKSTSEKPREKSLNSLTIPITSRSQSYQSDQRGGSSSVGASLPSPSSHGLSTSPLFRTRAKTLASLTTSSKAGTPSDMTPREFQLPHDPFVNGQPIEAYLYKDASECPICFLYYPPYLNTTRCCDQAICSECFVQIKRPDPHPPEHEQPDTSGPPQSEVEREASSDGELVSEVATCPYCKQPEFGITYVSPPFRRGLTYGAGSQPPYQVMSAMSSQTSVSSGQSSGPARRRGMSLSANAPEVITTDNIRPDWATKLATARAHAARRSAAATALHTAAYLMNGQPDTRTFGPFARRRRPTLEGLDAGTNPHLSALAMLAERHAARQQEMQESVGNTFPAPPRGSSSRRHRMDDLEEMMMMEAIRLSLASEEDRRKKEEKEAKKKAKKEGKEAKKAEKAGRKNSLFTLGSGSSNAEINVGSMERSQSYGSSVLTQDSPVAGKGKEAERPRTSDDGNTGHSDEATPKASAATLGASMCSASQESLGSSVPQGSEPLKRSHLRQMSNVSSSASSFMDSGSTHDFPGSNTPPRGANLEPMFNFRSLAAMIGEEDKAGDTSHIEDSPTAGRSLTFEEVDDKSPRSPISASSASSGPGEERHQVHDSTHHNGVTSKQASIVSQVRSEPTT